MVNRDKDLLQLRSSLGQQMNILIERVEIAGFVAKLDDGNENSRRRMSIGRCSCHLLDL